MGMETRMEILIALMIPMLIVWVIVGWMRFQPSSQNETDSVGCKAGAAWCWG